MNALLASVTSVEEAIIALQGGVDIIDLKNPLSGALGALPHHTISAIVSAINSQTVISATVGDLQPNKDDIPTAVQRMADCQVDIIKIGFFAALEDNIALIKSLQPLAQQHQLVAVLFADHAPQDGLLEPLAASGFYGVMLDTAGKQQGGLRNFKSDASLQSFIQHSRQLGLKTGLAGKLSIQDIAPLGALQADYLGFRSALCDAALRTNAIDPLKITHIRAEMNRIGRATAA